MNLLIILPRVENTDGVYERTLRQTFPQLGINCVETSSEVDPYIGAADILMTFSPMLADHVVRDAARLKWIQVLGSGVDGVVDLPSLASEVLITNGRGAQAVPVSEAVLALMLALGRQLPRVTLNQSARRWQRWPAQLLHERVVGIFGVGAIAAELARKCRAFGMRVVGISSSVRPVEGFERMYARSELTTAVRELDYLVLLTPYTADTHHIVSTEVLAAMKASAFLVNVGRGGLVNEEALAAALRRGAIGGAALDVFNEEPLPEQSELWSLPNIIISAHLAGINTSYPQHIMPLLVQNLRCFLAGDHSAMINRIER